MLDGYGSDYLYLSRDTRAVTQQSNSLWSAKRHETARKTSNRWRTPRESLNYCLQWNYFILSCFAHSCFSMHRGHFFCWSWRCWHLRVQANHIVPLHQLTTLTFEFSDQASATENGELMMWCSRDLRMTCFAYILCVRQIIFRNNITWESLGRTNHAE